MANQAGTAPGQQWVVLDLPPIDGTAEIGIAVGIDPSLPANRKLRVYRGGTNNDRAVAAMTYVLRNFDKLWGQDLNKGEDLGFSVDFTSGLVYKNRSLHKRSDKLLVPAALRRKLLELYHDSLFAGDNGIARTYDRLRREFYWGGMYQNCKDYVSACQICNMRKPDLHGKKAPLKSITMASRPAQFCSIDILGPLPRSNRGNKYILLHLDVFTRYVECVAIPDCKAHTVAKAYAQEVITRHGCSEKLICDNGGSFSGEVFRQVCQILRIKQHFIVAYRPLQNSHLERQNGVIAKIIAAYVNDGGTDWDEYLQFAAFSMRTAINASTRQTPFYLERGRDCIAPYENLIMPRRIDYAIGDAISGFEHEVVFQYFTPFFCHRISKMLSFIQKFVTMV